MDMPYNGRLLNKKRTIDTYKTRMTLKIILFSERSQAKKNIDRYSMIPFIQSSRKCKLIYSGKKKISIGMRGG